MKAKDMELILTVPISAKFGEVVKSDIVKAVRINTTLPVKGSLEDALNKAKEEAGDKEIWIDLKCRQLRIVNYEVKILNDGEVHYIELSHKIKLDIPTEVWSDNGKFAAEIVEVVDGNKLVIPGSVERKMGLPLANPGGVGIRPGMSVNILDSSLVIEGYLTEKDKSYIEAGKKAGIHNFMLSYFEQESDMSDVLSLDPDAELTAKIESKKGLEFVENQYTKYKKKLRLMAARGDLYTEVNEPDQIIDACEQIIKADPNAIFASRMFESLVDVDKVPRCQDLFDVYCGMLMGYRKFLIGDDICTRKDSVRAAIGLFEVLAGKYK